MKPTFLKTLALIAVASTTFFQTGCTKEKAEAVKAAAEQFRIEADKALEKTNSLLQGSVNSPPQEKEAELRKLVSELADEGAGVEQLKASIDGVMNRYKTTRAANQTIDTEFGRMSNEYALFADMFENLPRGHYFSKDAVASAERHSIRLTLRFVKMAREINLRRITFDAQRNQLVADLMAARALGVERDRDQAIQIVAQKAIDLRSAEALANEEAILQCLKAAEAGKVVTELIHNYSRMSVGDMVSSVTESLNLLNDITGGENEKIKGLLGKYNGFVDSKVKTDPLWKSVWDTEVNP